MKRNNKSLAFITLLVASIILLFPAEVFAANVREPGTLSISIDRPNVPVLPSLPPVRQLMAPTTSTWYLHTANTTVGNYTYHTVNTSGVAGTLATISAPVGTIGVDYLKEQAAGNHSIFASSAVPANTTWTLSGNMGFSVYLMSSSGTGYGRMTARVYEINTAGNLTWLFDTPWDTQDTHNSTSYARYTWTGTVPTTMLRAGERFGVQFLCQTNTASTGSLTMGYDIAAQNSSINVTYEQSAAPAATLNQPHYRIGYDRPLTSMQWRDDIDHTALNVPRDHNFRVRFMVYNYGTANKSWRPQLEWSTSSNTGFAAVPTSSGASPFFIAPTDNYTNAAPILTPYFGLPEAYSGTAWNSTTVNGTAYDTENPASVSIILPGGNANSRSTWTEIEFNIQANSNASYNTTYYFRLSDAGTPFDTYEVAAASITMLLSPSSSSPHYYLNMTTNKCAACHRAHSANRNVLRKTGTSEQTLCLTCHDGTGSRYDINDLLGSGNTTHNVSSTNWTHVWNEGTANVTFNGTRRHVECEDCHEPHSVYSRTLDTGNVAISPRNGRAFAIGVNNTSVWGNVTYLYQGTANYEYQVCFKCHSSWAYDGTPPRTPGGTVNSTNNATSFASQTNMAFEFNTLNYAHHAVEGKGNNQPPVWANANWAASNSTGLGLGNTFVAPWTANSTVQCSDCHGPSSNTSGWPQGPHGSNLRWMVKPYQGVEAVSSTAIFCYNCHQRAVYGDINAYTVTDNITFKHLWSRFNHRAGFLARDNAHYGTGAGDGNGANRWGIWCMNCHGGDVLGGIHGTNRGVGTSGTSILGKRFLNGAVVAGFTVGNTTTTGTFYQKGAADAVAICAEHNGGENIAAQYWNYDPVP